MENELPPELIYLWHWFIELDCSRGVGLDGKLPITYSEIEAWARLTGRSLQPWEVSAIKAIDVIVCVKKPEKGEDSV